MADFAVREVINGLIALYEFLLNTVESIKYDPEVMELNDEQKKAIQEFGLQCGHDYDLENQEFLILFKTDQEAELTKVERIEAGIKPQSKIGQNMVLLGEIALDMVVVGGLTSAAVKVLVGSYNKAMTVAKAFPGKKGKPPRTRVPPPVKEGILPHNPKNPGRGSITYETATHEQTGAIVTASPNTVEKEILEKTFLSKGYDVECRVTASAKGEHGVPTGDNYVRGLPGTKGNVKVELYQPQQSIWKN